MLAVARGRDPAAEKKAERGAGTFAELAERYLSEHAKRHNKSWEQPDRLVRRYLLPKWGKLQATTISRADVKALMARIEAPILANQVLAAASAIFSWAVKHEILAANPCRGVDRNKTTSRERILADSEVPKFWAAFDDAGLIISSALKVVLLTGQRPGEVANAARAHCRWLVADAGRSGARTWMAGHQEWREPPGMVERAGEGDRRRVERWRDDGRRFRRISAWSRPGDARDRCQAQGRAGNAARFAALVPLAGDRPGLRP
jgi:hypothetical protein